MFLALTFTTLHCAQGAVPSSSHPAAEDVEQVHASRAPELVSGGPYAFEPSVAPDDSVPLPVPAVIQIGADGDVAVAPAAGDPFFLGFAAGAHYPADDERVDPELYAQLQSQWTDGRPAQETYAFVMFGQRITAERLAMLADLGARPLGFHPHYCMKVALAPASIDALVALDFVRWVGVPKAWQKQHPALQPAIDMARPGEPVDVWINVYDSDLNPESTSTPIGSVSFGGPDGVEVADDSQRPQVWMSNGWQQRALQDLGVEVREYVDELKSFRARLQPAALELVVGLDFVQFVEPELEPSLAHDESMPMILADRTRASWNGGTSASVVGGQVDSGIEYSHVGIGGFTWVSVNFTGESAIDDLCGHGTHVAGTFMGDGDVDDSYEGVANGLGWGATGRFFIGKHFSGTGCASSGASLASIMAGLHGSYTDGSGNVTPRPHVINHSWGTLSGGAPWIGTEADAREIDAEVYTYGQLHVWAAGNEGSAGSSLRLQPSAKNAFTVGGVRDYRSGSEDPGALYSSSSRGPAGDNRWKPNVCAPATQILSADADNLTGYVNKTGTSMAAPHVSGLAAQLCDHFSFLRYNPPTLGAVLMATGMTKDGFDHGVPSSSSTHHLNTFGASRIEALNAHLMGAGTAQYHWGWTQGTSGVNYVDVPIGSGATRIDVCLFYTEPASSSGASQALVNDLDLWIDRPPITSGATGEYYGHQSSINNVEIRTVLNPAAGTWRLKVDSASATTNSKVGLCAFIIYGDLTPDGSLNVTANDLFVKPNENVAITASAYNPSYIASAVFFDSTSSGDSLQSSTMTHEDGATASLMNNQHFGRDLLVGDIAPGDTRSAVWTTRWSTEGVKSWSVNARSDNWVDETDSVNVTVDGTPPPVPTGLSSTTHTPGVWSNDASISFAWTQPADNLSGVDGYSWSLTNGSATLPDAVKDIGAVTSFSTTLPGTSGLFAFNLRPVDESGNWQTLLTYTGFFPFDALAPAAVVGLSSDHAPFSYSCTSATNMSWSAPADTGGSGIDGYSFLFDHAAATIPDDSLELSAPATGHGAALSPSSMPWYFHVKALDVAGNAGPTTHAGPFNIISPTPLVYCTGKVNSLGCVPSAGYSGYPSKSAGNFTVTCANVINNKVGHVFWGYTQAAIPFQGGIKCIAAPTHRTPNQLSGGSPLGNDCTGTFAFNFDTAYMNANGMLPGQTFYAQWWMRDPGSPSTTGLSNAVCFTVCE